MDSQVRRKVRDSQFITWNSLSVATLSLYLQFSSMWQNFIQIFCMMRGLANTTTQGEQRSFSCMQMAYPQIWQRSLLDESHTSLKLRTSTWWFFSLSFHSIQSMGVSGVANMIFLTSASSALLYAWLILLMMGLRILMNGQGISRKVIPAPIATYFQLRSLKVCLILQIKVRLACYYIQSLQQGHVSTGLNKGACDRRGKRVQYRWFTSLAGMQMPKEDMQN